MNDIRIVHPDMDKVVYLPDFETINKEAIKILLDKFKEYGNSWVRNSSHSFWDKRIKDEFDEMLEAKTPEEFRNEILDMYNVLGMMYENTYDIFSLRGDLQETIQGISQ